ncbi:MAG: hypothetical protein JNK58_14115 [Phycisphaerae bacterium]|nr:hypothetical protein [Phycisphaerae bacterium]
MFRQAGSFVVASVVVGAGFSNAAVAQVIAPEFAAQYSLTDLGSAPGVPPLYGGLTFKFDDPNTILLGGNANAEPGALYAVRVIRDMDNHIIGFDGNAEFFADAAYNDGGVAYEPTSNVLFTSRWPANEMGQLKPGSTTTDKIIDLAPLGVAQSNASVNFVPAGYPGAGRMKMASWSGGQWYEATIAPDGLGTFDITSITQVLDSTLPGGPEGFTYVPLGSPIFGYNPTMIVSEYGAGNVAVYDMDANGDPIVASRRLFISNLVGAEGAVIDPLTGDFIFSTFEGGDRLVRVSGFAVPGAASVCPIALAGLALFRRRR